MPTVTAKHRGADTRTRSGLSTFGGFFTPSVFTILVLILLLRLGYVVGSSGLVRGLLMLVLATLISVLTSLSLSAIATNRKLRSGGDYYLISRSLGVEYGSAIGLILYVAQTISVALYCVDFGEGVVQLSATGAPIGLFALAYVGAGPRGNPRRPTGREALSTHVNSGVKISLTGVPPRGTCPP